MSKADAEASAGIVYVIVSDTHDGDVFEGVFNSREGAADWIKAHPCEWPPFAIREIQMNSTIDDGPAVNTGTPALDTEPLLPGSAPSKP